MLSNFILYSGDCNEIIQTFNDKTIDCAFTSPTPPVKDTEVASLVQSFSKLKPKISEMGGLWVNLKNFYSDNQGELPLCEFFVLAMRQEGWTFFADVFWHRFPHDKSKPKDPPHFYYDVEHMYYFTHDMNCYFNDRLGLHNTSVIVCPTEIVRPNEFKSGFPEKVADILLKVTSKPGDVILDPFCGTGTTGVVALKLGRNFIGIDKGNQEYIEKVENRLRKFGFNERLLVPPIQESVDVLPE